MTNSEVSADRRLSHAYTETTQSAGSEKHIKQQQKDFDDEASETAGGLPITDSTQPPKTPASV